MKKLKTFHFSEGPQAGLLKNLLEEQGIACLLRNDRLFAAMGEIPFLECFPELWVIDDENYDRARRILADWEGVVSEDQQEWICPRCGERIDGFLAECWNCGNRPER